MKVIIFGGTSEGRSATQERLKAGDTVIVCVTSDYARRLLPSGPQVLTQAMDEVQMRELIIRERPDEIIDATHPFAVRVSENIRRAAADSGVPIRRILRAGSGHCAWIHDVEWAANPAEAAEALARTKGNILLTTGSHTLSVYTHRLGTERIFARVLPMVAALQLCEELGLPSGHVIAMQGPFPSSLNGALYDALGIRVLLTKDSGEPGGVSDKVLPALERDIHVVVIRRPEEGSHA